MWDWSRPLSCKAGDPSLIFSLERFIYTQWVRARTQDPFHYVSREALSGGREIAYIRTTFIFPGFLPNLMTSYIYKVLIWLSPHHPRCKNWKQENHEVVIINNNMLCTRNFTYAFRIMLINMGIFQTSQNINDLREYLTYSSYLINDNF